jgi:antitoxin CcdA
MRITSTAPGNLHRKTTIVSLDAGMVAEAKQLQINISQTSESGLAQAVAAKRAAMWLETNREALDSSNAHVAQNGLPLARHRQF